MFVSRSDVSFRVSIQRDSCATGAKAIASSDEGNGSSLNERTKWSRVGPDVIPGSVGFHKVAGASESASETFRGPVRRSRYCASDVRHEEAACCLSASVIVTCISFSASAKVCGETSGPLPAPVPNVGGAPGGADVDWEVDVDLLRQAAVATSKASGACTRNWRRVFMAGDYPQIERISQRQPRYRKKHNEHLAVFVLSPYVAEFYFEFLKFS